VPENESTEIHADGADQSTDPQHLSADVARHPAPGRFSGRGRYLVVALVALAGLGLAGVAAAAVDHGGASTAVAVDEQARTDAAQRANRSARDRAITPSESASPTASASATAQPSPTATKAAPAKPAAKKAAPATKAKAAWVNPMPGAEITSCFGIRGGILHAGIDLAQPAGTAIHAAAAGTVTGAGWLYTGYGISVTIDHGNGYLTHYAHQSRTVVQAGQHVSAGDIIGYEGATGDATGPHLHFEVHHGLWNQIDPAPWLRARGVDLGC
jgi:murein DD-endopeptidase MepM/ murein hydrolase activator NlpD